jgi:methionyl-tRNA synthetase
MECLNSLKRRKVLSKKVKEYECPICGSWMVDGEECEECSYQKYGEVKTQKSFNLDKDEERGK